MRKGIVAIEMENNVKILEMLAGNINAPFRRNDLGSDADEIKVFVFGTCNVSEVVGYAGAFGARVSHQLWQPLETLDKIDTGKFDLSVLSITFRDFFRECGFSELVFPRLRSSEEVDVILEVCYSRLEFYIEKFSEVCPSIPVFVPSFLEPSLIIRGSWQITSETYRQSILLGS